MNWHLLFNNFRIAILCHCIKVVVVIFRGMLTTVFKQQMTLKKWWRLLKFLWSNGRRARDHCGSTTVYYVLRCGDCTCIFRLELVMAHHYCGACRKTWCLTDTDLCSCGETQTMSHIVESCPLMKLNGGLSQLHSADDAATAWLTNYGS